MNDNVYLIEEVSGGGWDVDWVGAYDNFAAAVFAAIDILDNNDDDHINFAELTVKQSGVILIWSKWGVEYSVSKIVKNMIHK